MRPLKGLNPSPEKGEKNGDVAAELAPDHDPTIINIKVSHGLNLYEVALPSNSSFGNLKSVMAQKTGLKPELIKLLFRGKEKEDCEDLQTAGVKDSSKVLLMEDMAYQQKSPEELKDASEISRGDAAVVEIRAEVDKLSEQVSALQAVVDGGTKIDNKDIIYLTEMLMRQLLKLDGIEAEGEGRVQRRLEVRRVQGLVETMDILKSRNSNLIIGTNKSESVTTPWETFEPDSGSSTVPSPRPSSVPSSEPSSPPPALLPSAPSPIPHSDPLMLPHSDPSPVPCSSPSSLPHPEPSFRPYSNPSSVTYCNPSMMPYSNPYSQLYPEPRSAPSPELSSDPSPVPSASYPFPYSASAPAPYPAPSAPAPYPAPPAPAPHPAHSHPVPYSAPYTVPNSAFFPVVPYPPPYPAPHSSPSHAVPYPPPYPAPHSSPSHAVPYPPPYPVPHSSASHAVSYTSPYPVPHSSPSQAVPYPSPYPMPRSKPSPVSSSFTKVTQDWEHFD